MLDIYIDADACPVKAETYRVAERYGLTVHVATSLPMRAPESERARLVVIEGGIDAVDDWIAEHAGQDDIVVTGDIPLARRCIERGARVIGHKGRIITASTIGELLATRDLLDHLRSAGEITGGPAPFTRRDRSRYLSQLDTLVQSVRRARPQG